ncbi:phosphotransferase [Promicromonospora sukumoe]|uniref:phosphotransferase family protein n=1 Tax=Promicromonospora sukumoe TaxID=88382 RepID=UPI00364D66A5
MTDSIPADSTPVEPTPVESGSAEPSPVDSGPADSGHVEPSRVDSDPADSGPADLSPADSSPADSSPADSSPVEPPPVAPGTAGPNGVGIGPRIGVGREAEVYAWGPDAVVKLYRSGFDGHHNEALALAGLAGYRVAPALVDVVTRDGRPGLVLERVAGADMLDVLRRRPWQVRALARTLAETHLAVHEVLGPADLPDVRQVLAARIDDATLSRELRGFALRLLDGLPSGDRLCHGDYHPGNVMVGGDRVSVIDWPNAARGVPEADHARAILLLQWADPLPAAPYVGRRGGPGLARRGLIAAGRSMLTRGYALTYADGAPGELHDLESWLVVHAAARLSEGVAAERARLLDWLVRAQHAFET